MNRFKLRQLAFAAFMAIAAIAASLCSSSARAQDGAYTVREDRPSSSSVGQGSPEDGPVRLARFSYVEGSVTWRPDDSAEWSSATVNLPIRQGAQIWITGGGRAEIQFDDGSLIRLGNNAVATLQTLYSDGEGEFTEIKLTDGVAALRLKHDHSIFQVDTPLVSVKSTGPSRLRIGAGDGVEIAVRGGSATVEGPQGRTTMRSGDYLDVANEDSALEVRALPKADSWEIWNDDRDAAIEAADRDNSQHRLPSNIALVATDLSGYGTWHNEAQYGWVWCPRLAASDWRPYEFGRWTWVNPFGWTWVSDEAWGWAPYHYGTWNRFAFGWGWVPGPAAQYWSPAIVHFTECDGRVAWCPLAPAEIRYGTLTSVYRSGRNWATYFSIGQAAIYYPAGGSYCEPRAFTTTRINQGTFISAGAPRQTPGAYGRFRASSEFFAANSNGSGTSAFIPVNSRLARGVTSAGATQFGTRGRYEPVNQSAAALFQRGRQVSAPQSGRAPSAGPAAMRPTAQDIAPTGQFVQAPAAKPAAFTTPVYRASLRPGIANSSAPVATVGSAPSSATGIGRTPRTGGTGVYPGSPRDGSVSAGRLGTSVGSNGSSSQPGQAAVLTPAQIRAREARRALGLGDSAGAGTSRPRTGGGVSSPGVQPSGDTGRREGAAPPRGTPPPGSVRRDPPVNRTGSPAAPQSDPRTYDPTAGRGRTPGGASADPRRDAPQPQQPGRTPVEPRRDSPSAPQPPAQPVQRAPEPRRESPPASQPPAQPVQRAPEPRRDPSPPQQAPQRAPEPRRDPPPAEPRRSPPADPPKQDRGDGGSSGGTTTPLNGRGRR